MSLAGGCLCGAIRYQITGEGYDPVNCHCRRCRRSVGGPFVPWVSFHADEFTYTKGVPTEHLSSPRVVREFCGDCGTSLTNRNDDKPEEIVVTICSLDEPEAVQPEIHIWTRERLHWVHLADELSERVHE